MDTVESALADIAVQWDKAEKLVKAAERARAQVVIASINELRYAGRRLVDAYHLSESAKSDPLKRDEFDKHIKEVSAFCVRAQHDAIDAMVLFLQKAVEKYEAEFGLALLGEKYPPIFEMRTTLAEVDGLIVASREDRARRSEEYDKLAEIHYPKLISHYQHLQSSRDILLEMLREKKKREGGDLRRYWWVILATFAAAILGALIGAYASKVIGA